MCFPSVSKFVLSIGFKETLQNDDVIRQFHFINFSTINFGWKDRRFIPGIYHTEPVRFSIVYVSVYMSVCLCVFTRVQCNTLIVYPLRSPFPMPTIGTTFRPVASSKIPSSIWPTDGPTTKESNYSTLIGSLSAIAILGIGFLAFLSIRHRYRSSNYTALGPERIMMRHLRGFFGRAQRNIRNEAESLV